ncbi:hypothetical protein ACFQ34_03685 [Pseudonocardia benzenivorans]|jgi:hypothetical protein|uniref:Uncharacterized protein n=2 Tax=Pseudonocardia TaxID=1847 RepID=F4CTP0_PSEUX|nr:hypothetical protein [Pseudonocardia dioxanivorans]AEA28543.1 hypothetical protein Psed_6452 [Pseudonocardia dioxanivorans CB1190]GJF02009.1 hypothetical protein PSD17_09730 [Pseudonocardia sp. D17]
MTVLYVLDVADFRPLAEVASKEPDTTVHRRGPYLEVEAAGGIRIERGATGCRNAVWYSSVAAVAGGRVARWDKVELVVEPIDEAP